MPKKVREKARGRGWKTFFTGVLSMRRSDEHNNKQTEQTVEVSNQKIKRKLSIKSVGAKCAEWKTHFVCCRYYFRSLSHCVYGDYGVKFDIWIIFLLNK